MSASIVTLGLPHHIGVVVKDVEQTAEFLSLTLGIGPWEISRNLIFKEMFVGQPFRLNAAHANLESVELELLQPLEEGSLWGQFLKTKGEGLHHIAFKVSNWDERVSELRKQANMVVGGINPYGKRWAYFEIKPGGIIVELDENI
jgi:methylmalonyl-CoA/ethylmalonyl-CoA epimerase